MELFGSADQNNVIPMLRQPAADDSTNGAGTEDDKPHEVFSHSRVKGLRRLLCRHSGLPLTGEKQNNSNHSFNEHDRVVKMLFQNCRQTKSRLLPHRDVQQPFCIAAVDTILFIRGEAQPFDDFDRLADV